MTSAARVLVVDDETVFAKAVQKRLRQADFDCAVAGTLAQAAEHLRREPPDLMLLDMRLPDGSGLEFLQRLRNTPGPQADVAVVVLTAYSEIEDAVAAMKQQALDYLKKPLDLDELVICLQNAWSRLSTRRQLDHSRQREQHASARPELLGTSPAMLQAREQIARIAELASKAGDAPPNVLILGETGTGKDVAARSLHDASSRNQRPLVQVDCASLPKELIEAELFGHEKGAYTGAQGERIGLLQAAEDGTVLLDEIGEVPLELQAKLLSVLERRALRRIGSSKEQVLAAWFIAATNRSLEAMVAAGEFRADLYFRLNILSLTMPPLRQRGNDVQLLATHYAERSARRYGLSPPSFGTDALAALAAYHWPGNVRELVNVIERAVMLSGGGELTAANLMLQPPVPSIPVVRQPLSTAVDSPAATAAVATVNEVTLESAEADLIRQALDRSGGNVSQAARQLGVTRMTLRYRMQKYAIER